MGLLIKNLDIDYHVYSEKFNLSESFSAIAEIAENPGIKKVQYTNLIDTPEKCVEWHLWFEDLDKREWKIDMIHILKESQYAGVFENIADRIKATLTGESKMAILEIKNQLTSDDNTMGIEVYMAVIRDGINNIHEFRNWKKEQPPAGIIEWTP
ncbi:MAG: phosphoglycerate mutase family protein, partial [Bacteroidota bacterium]